MKSFPARTVKPQKTNQNGRDLPLDVRLSLIINRKLFTMKTLSQDVLKKIADQLASLKFGELTVVVHDGKVVQIEVKEKIRLTQ